MKYNKFNKNDKSAYNLVFIYEDKLSGISKSIDCSTALKDIKEAVSKKLLCGKLSSMETFVSTMYDSNYFLIGLGKKNELTIQKFEKQLSMTIKKINEYDIDKVAIDLNNI